ncbi:MAG: type I-E CRISPR-associated protein Cse1/CasA, partial [Solirubrobacteraceae bacterium]
MPCHFNLISEPWIPVAYDDGSTGVVGWRDLIADSGRIVDVTTDPSLSYGVVARFATALVLRTQGAPLSEQSPAAWQRWGTDRLEAGVDVAELDAYLETWRDRFWLIDETHPFLQDPSIATECAERASTNKLFFEVASGNNHLWWTKTPDDAAPTVPFAAAAMAILGQWCYSAGGGCATRNGVSIATQSPLRRFTQFIPRGHTLFETLLMCCTPAVLDAQLAVRDAPVWELDPSATPTPGQLGRLTASTRGLLLVPGDDGIEAFVNTLAAGGVKEDFWDAEVFMAKKIPSNGKPPVPVRLSQADAVWREVPSILANQPVADARLSPLVLDAVRNPLGLTDVFDKSGVTVLTHFTNQSKDVGWGRSDIPDILAARESRDPAVFIQVSTFCEVADHVIKDAQSSLTQEARAIRSG